MAVSSSSESKRKKKIKKIKKNNKKKPRFIVRSKQAGDAARGPGSCCFGWKL